jgi:hypothetical protein
VPSAFDNVQVKTDSIAARYSDLAALPPFEQSEAATGTVQEGIGPDPNTGARHSAGEPLTGCNKPRWPTEDLANNLVIDPRSKFHAFAATTGEYCWDAGFIAALSVPRREDRRQDHRGVRRRLGHADGGGLDPGRGHLPGLPSYKKVLRGVLQALNRRREDKKGASLSRDLLMCLQFLLFTLARWQPVEIPLTLTAKRPVIMYVNAFFEADSSRSPEVPASQRYFGNLGALVIDAHGKLHAFAATIREILPDELIAPRFLAHTAPELLEGQHPIIFGGHLGGVCSTIEGSSPEWDLHYIIGATHHKFDKLLCTWWMEWVPTDANPADECLEAMCRLYVAHYPAGVPGLVAAYRALRSPPLL